MVDKSKTDIWMPLYIADYLADTSRLTTVQHGAYLLLIMDYWRNGALPDDDLVLSQITRMTIDAWSIARAVLVRFFSIADGMWIHKRIEDEMKKAGDNAQKAHERAVKAAAARWGKENAASNATSNANEVLEECPSPSPSPSPSKAKLKSKSFLEALDSLPENRVDAKTPTAKKTTKGTRLSEDWFLPKSWGEWALSERPDFSEAEVKKQAERFRDHWISISGKNGVRINWEATWRNWIRGAYVKNESKVKTGRRNFHDAQMDVIDQIFGRTGNGSGEQANGNIIDVTPSDADRLHDELFQRNKLGVRK